MAVTLFLGVAIFPYILPALIVHLSPPPSSMPAPFNVTDQIIKSMKVQQALEKNMSNPCSPAAILNQGILCLPQNNNLIQLYHGNGTA